MGFPCWFSFVQRQAANRMITEITHTGEANLLYSLKTFICGIVKSSLTPNNFCWFHSHSIETRWLAKHDSEKTWRKLYEAAISHCFQMLPFDKYCDQRICQAAQANLVTILEQCIVIVYFNHFTFLYHQQNKTNNKLSLIRIFEIYHLASHACHFCEGKQEALVNFNSL